MSAITSFEPLYQFVVIALMITAIVVILRWRGVFDESYQQVFNKLVTELGVPAVIFSIFVTQVFSIETLVPAGILFLTLLVTLSLAYGVCRVFRTGPGMTGTLVMISGFGSTATMAGVLFDDLFPFQDAIVGQGITVGTLGVAFPFFTLGVMIASHFGAKEQGRDVSVLHTLREFLVTPIFVSFILGVIVSLLLSGFKTPVSAIFVDVFTQFFTIINLSMALLIWIAIGLMLRPIHLKTLVGSLVMVVILKMLVGPLFAWICGGFAGISPMGQEILLLESAVPAGAFAAVLASRYGCDGTLAGWMVVGTYLVSLVTIPILFLLLV